MCFTEMTPFPPAPSSSLAKRPKRRRDERGKTLTLVASLSEICYLPSGCWRYYIYLFDIRDYTGWSVCLYLVLVWSLSDWMSVLVVPDQRASGGTWAGAQWLRVDSPGVGLQIGAYRVASADGQLGLLFDVSSPFSKSNRITIIKIENCRFFYSRKNGLPPLAMAEKCRWFHCRPCCCQSFCPWPATTWWGPSGWTRRLVPRLNTWCSFLLSSLYRLGLFVFRVWLGDRRFSCLEKLDNSNAEFLYFQPRKKNQKRKRQ